jgi:hypothetical protein
VLVVVRVALQGAHDQGDNAQTYEIQPDPVGGLSHVVKTACLNGIEGDRHRETRKKTNDEQPDRHPNQCWHGGGVVAVLWAIVGIRKGGEEEHCEWHQHEHHLHQVHCEKEPPELGPAGATSERGVLTEYRLHSLTEWHVRFLPDVAPTLARAEHARK